MQVLIRPQMCGGKGRSYTLKVEQSFPLIQGPITGTSSCWEASLEGLFFQSLPAEVGQKAN